MTSVSVDPASGRITAAGGALWGHVYAEAAKFELAAVGGISPTVGVGGLAIHGGYGWLTGAHGLAADSILEIEVVLANGSIVCASDKVNEDLFWAMKGAGAAFGAVTKFVLQGYEQREWVWSGNLLFKKGNEKTVAQVCNKILSRESRGEAALGWGWSVLPSGAEPVIWAMPWYNGPEQKAREFFAPLLSLNPMVDTTKMVPFSASGTASASAPGRELRKCGQGSSIMAPLDADFFESLFSDFAAFLERVPDARKSMVAFEAYNPYPTIQVGQTATAYPNRGYQINVQVIPTWTKKQNDEICKGWCQEFITKMAEEFERRKNEDGVDEVTRTSVGIYSNYDGELLLLAVTLMKESLTRVFTGFRLSPKQLFGVNYEKLLDLKRKYDSRNLFRSFVDFYSTT